MSSFSFVSGEGVKGVPRFFGIRECLCNGRRLGILLCLCPSLYEAVCVVQKGYCGVVCGRVRACVRIGV